MTDETLDRRSRAEATRISAESAAIADTDAALEALMHPTAPVLPDRRRRPRRLLVGALGGGIAAAIAAVVTVTLAAGPDDDGRPNGGSTETVSAPPAPSTSDPAPITAAPPSVVSTSVASLAPTSPASTPSDPTAVDRLAAWPRPPAALPTLADVPLLLPTAAIPIANRVEWSDGEATEPTDSPLYEQEWVVAGEQPRLLTIRTKLYPSIDGLQNTTRVDVEGWDEAYAGLNAPEHGSIVLREPSGSVSVVGQGLTQVEVERIAAELQTRDDGPGWLLPDLGDSRLAALVPMIDRWSMGGASTQLDWFDDETYVAQLSLGAPGYWGPSTVHYGDPLQLVDVNGATAAVSAAAGRVGISWSPSPGVSALVGYRGTAEDALRFVRSLQPVDRATWEAAGVPSPIDDGCQSMFC
jgi:hypothetical protein